MQTLTQVTDFDRCAGPEAISKLTSTPRQAYAGLALLRKKCGIQGHVFLRILLLISLCAAPAGSGPYASSRWIRFKSAHFELLTSADKRQGQSLILFFEQMRSFFAASALSAARVPDPVKIIAFNSDPEFASYRLNEATAAFFAGGSNGDYIVMKSASAEYRPMAIHEYVHLQVRYSGLPAPLWWQEGLAEFYSTLLVTKNRVEIGAVNARHYSLLKRQPLMELPTLFGADRYSDLYNRMDQAPLFYAESWAIVHMLLLSEQYGPKADDFVKLLATGMDPLELFPKVYGKTIAQVQDDLAAYLQKGAFARRSVPVNPERIAEIPAPTPAADLELQVALANVSLGIGKDAQARRILDSLSRAYPDSWEVEEALGYLSWYEADRDQARIHFGRAVDKGLANAKSYLDYVGLLTETGTANSTLITLLEKALQLQPDNPPATLKLAELYLSKGRYAQVLERIAGMKDMPPGDVMQALCLQAYAHLGLGETIQARKAAEGARQYARTAVEKTELEQLFRALAAPAPTGPLTLPGPGIKPTQPVAVPQVDRAAVTTAADKAATSRQPPAPEVRQIEGRLRRIDCLDTNLSFVIQAGGRDWAFLILDPARITVKGKKGDKVLFYCGLQPGMPVLITYAPKPNPKFGTAGEVIAIEYL